ncbi:MAG: hypothetical protein IJZ77_04850 [Bacilli bacterium]|nr:hypothetical protein [Bacilli bacterium]
MKVIKDETGVYMELPRDKIKFVSKEAEMMFDLSMENDYLEKENKELHNKIDEISDFIKENKVKRYRPIEGEEYDEEIVLDEDDITCLERIMYS